jgi:tetratricopeptide (TPR) repeat protein/translation elongation factor P/translation initiation factor 5A
MISIGVFCTYICTLIFKKLNMKVSILFLSLFFIIGFTTAQTKPTSNQKPPATSEMDKQMEDAMQGMSEEDKAEMQKMMKGMMPDMTQPQFRVAYYPEFNSNQQLVPKKDMARINALPKKKLSQADMSSYASNLYNKLLAKGDADEMVMAKKVIAQAPKANDIGGAAILCMMQGHPQAAMALSMKAVITDPANPNWQNNMASLLTQYGYPEQAIPVLQKLKIEFPNNSTVLNNLGQAWFDMGVLDSAKIFANLAISANPFHPEAKVCGGLIEEINGDPIKATKDYTEAMENAPNPVIEKILKNKTGDNSFDKIDFEKLKRSITIYEYFPKDWIKIPKLSDNVSGYENDMRIQNGNDKMIEELKDKIETLSDASLAEVNSLMEKGEDAFVSTMANESMKGLNVMSRTAVTVEMILQIYIAKWMKDYVYEGDALHQKINAARITMTKIADNDKCPDFDRKNNEFLAYANPLVREFHAKKIDEFRIWLNAFCTWSWYIVGNPKNTIMTACIGWTAALAGFYENAIDDQEAIAKSCVKQNGDGKTFVPTPNIPNFSCPTIVRIPMGKDWQELGSAVKNFDANSLGIKSNPSNPIPNNSIAFGGSAKSIAQPGKAPFTKTANGSILPGMINETDDELAPLPDLRRSKLLKDLLKKMMTADCKNLNKYKPPVFEVRLGELTIENPSKNIKEIKEDGDVTYVTYDDGSVAVFMEDGSILEIDAPSKNIKETKEDGNMVHVTYDDGSEAIFMEDGSILELEAPSKNIKETKEDDNIVHVTYDDGSEAIFFEDGSILEMDAPKDSEKTVTEKITLKPKTVTPDVASKNKVYTDLKGFKSQFDANSMQPSLNSGVQAPGTFAPLNGLFK